MDSDPKSMPKKRLPKSGLAEDILASMMEELESASSSERHQAPTESLPAAEPPPPPRPSASSYEIYDFADTLESRRRVEEEVEEKLETWVTFSLAGETFALPVTHVQEILRVTTITRVPHVPPAVRGITNLRGRVLPVVDLRLRIELPEKEIEQQSRILVVGSRGRLIGLLVDSVQQVARLAINRVEPPPRDVMTAQSDYIRGVYQFKQETLVILLNVDKILLIHKE